jgi:hypothetical protein
MILWSGMITLAKTIKFSHLWRTIKTNDMKQTAVEWLFKQLCSEKLSWNKDSNGKLFFDKTSSDILQQAKEMEKKQLFLASNQSAKEAYKAGQKTMNCGCYEISDATTYEEWLYEQFKSE